MTDAPESSTDPATSQEAETKPARRSYDAVRIRGIVARVAWAVFLTIALILAVAAFSFALDANEKNTLVKAVRGLADVFDLGLFDRENPVWQAQGANAEVKTVLANYGLAAVGYLVVGRIVERVIRI